MIRKSEESYEPNYTIEDARYDSPPNLCLFRCIEDDTILNFFKLAFKELVLKHLSAFIDAVIEACIRESLNHVGR